MHLEGITVNAFFLPSSLSPALGHSEFFTKTFRQQTKALTETHSDCHKFSKSYAPAMTHPLPATLKIFLCRPSFSLVISTYRTHPTVPCHCHAILLQHPILRSPFPNAPKIGPAPSTRPFVQIL